MGYILEALCCLLFKYRKAVKEYRRDIGKYTTKEAWEKYLGLDENEREGRIEGRTERRTESKTERRMESKMEIRSRE